MGTFLDLRTFRGRIRLFAFLLIFLPLAFGAGLFALFMKGYVQDAAVRELHEGLERQRSLVESWMRERLRDVEFLAGLEPLRHGDLALTGSVFQGFLAKQSDVSAMVLVDRGGRSVADTGAPAGLDLSDREYFKAGREGQSHVTGVLIGRTSGQPVVIFSAPVRGEAGAFNGVVFAAVRLASISNLFTGRGMRAGAETYLVNREGLMLSESGFLDVLKERDPAMDTSLMKVWAYSPVLAAALSGGVHRTPYRNYRGVEVIGACVPVKQGEWLLVVETPLAGVLGGYYSSLGLVVGGGLLALVVLIPLLVRTVAGIERPVEKLVEMSGQMMAGTYDASCPENITKGSPKELVRLYETFCRMNDTIQATIAALERSAVTDQLTGAHNRRFLMTEGARLLEVSRRAGQPCSCFMLDIDRFKAVNDTYGHAAGDEVLKAIAGICLGAVRASDIFARYGGEEFAIVASNSNLEKSRVLAERIRQAVEGYPFSAGGAKFRCTVSIGVAESATGVRYGSLALEDVLARADRALYRAKQAGRNRVELEAAQ